MSASSFSMAATSSRECSSCARSAGSPTSAAASRSASHKAAFVRSASRPPLSSTALPLLSASDAICTSASGRLSKITPMTPIGQVTRYIFSPCVISVRHRRRADGVGQSSQRAKPVRHGAQLLFAEFQPAKQALPARPPPPDEYPPRSPQKYPPDDFPAPLPSAEAPRFAFPATKPPASKLPPGCLPPSREDPSILSFLLYHRKSSFLL